LIDLFPSERHDDVRTQLSMSLRFVIAQHLLPSGNGGRRVLAMEVLYANFAVRSAVRQGKIENLESATAPAQQVKVTDLLDANLDYDTLELTSVGFGDILVAIPPGRQHFQTVLDVTQNSQDFQVHVLVDFEFETVKSALHELLGER